MKRLVSSLTLGLCGLALTSTLALAQGGSTRSSLSGLVVDTAGGIIPGATVIIKNDATGVVANAVTNGSGVFSLPSLDAGTYTVIISLSGFKTVVIKDVKVISASPADLSKITLDVGSLTETVEVTGGRELVQTQSGAISSTLNTEQLKNVPLQTRNALYAVNLLPGVDTTGGPRAATISGLPQNTINISLDGINVSNNMQRASDGFYAMVRPQLDAIEEVTVTQATQGADSAGQGAVQIRFTTRSGTNEYKGTLYDYYRNPALNTNYWFNKKNGLEKNKVELHQGGGSYSGPIRLPGLFDGRGKAFFFFNYEEFYQPTEATRTRTILSDEAQSGLFRYTVTNAGVSTVQSVDLVKLATDNGQLATFDPTVSALLSQIRGTTRTTGVVNPNPNNPNLASFIYLSPGQGREHLPTTKIDLNLNSNHKLSGAYYWQVVDRSPDILNGGDSSFPGMANVSNFTSIRSSGSVTLRSTLSSSLVNELLTGWQYSPNHFSSGNSPETFANQGGFSLGFPGNPLSLTGVTASNSSEDRLTPNWDVDDTVTWLRGQHNLSLGASFTQIVHDDVNWSMVPSITFGVQTTVDPADAMFTAANFPGASNANLTDARTIYAFLTGRVTAINGTSRLDANNEYIYLGKGRDYLRLREFGTFIQDSWRVSPTLTLNAGARWEYQSPITPLNGNYSTATFADLCGQSGVGSGPGGRGCNIFKPNTLTGQKSQYIQYSTGTKGYKNDYNNVAPNVSAAWRPNAKNGFLRSLLGDPEQATLRAGFSIAYNRNGMDEFTGIFGANPGRSFTANRNNTNNNLVLPGQSWPLLLRQTDRLGPPPTCPAGTVAASCVPASPSYPFAATTANTLAIFDPDIQLSYARSYSVGLQRALSKDMVVEARYVGTRNINGWTTENWNEINVEENGFLPEFKLAMANLQANIASGRGASLAYFGAGTGTAPLPIFLAHFNGVAPALAGDATKYTGANWTNSTFTGFLAANNPQIVTNNSFGTSSSTNGLYGNATFRANGIAAGLPANFWVMNPDVGSANIRRSASFTRYDSLQIELRRRLSRGLSVSGNYTYARQWGSSLESLHRERYLLRTTGTNAIPHAWKFNGTYAMPVGHGKRYGSGMNSWVDNIIGGWDTAFAARFQYRLLSATGVRLVGMTEKDLQKAYRIRVDDATKTVYIFPDEIILNTRRAFNVSATTPDGYSTALGAPQGRYIAPASQNGCVELYLGDCGEPKQLIIRAPLFTRFDLSFKKTIALPGRKSFQIQYDILNLLDNINFTPVFNPGTGATIFQVGSAYTDLSNSYDPGGRLGQLMIRFNW